MDYINLNGKITGRKETGLPLDNGAFRYGYGLFETMLVKDGVIRLSAFHWERLFSGLKQLYFELPTRFTPEWLEKQVMATVAKNKAGSVCRVRLQVFAGGGGIFSPESEKPGFIIECFPVETESTELNENGLITGLATGLSKSMDNLANLKSCNALIYVMAGRQAKKNKWNDAIICNTQGNIIETCIANIFWIKNKDIYTPPLSEGCVAGTMRRHILNHLPGIHEKSLERDELYLADEVFFTNAIKGIKWVAKVENNSYSSKMIKEIYRHCFA